MPKSNDKNDFIYPPGVIKYPIWGVEENKEQKHAISYIKEESIFDRIYYLCIELENVYKYKIFPKIGQAFYFWESLTPLWFTRGGLGSDVLISAEQYNIYLNTSPFARKFQIYDKSEFHKHLYMYDCRNLVQHLNDRVIFTEHLYNDFYKAIYNSGKTRTQHESMDMIINNDEEFYWNSAYKEASILHSLIINLYAILDILTKVVYELEHLHVDFSKTCKLNSRNETYGSQKKLNKLFIKETILERCEITKKIEFLRNEIVHNGSIEALPKIHFICKEDKLVKKIMYCPDYNLNGFKKNNNRNRFYSQKMTFNEEVRNICVDFWTKTESTLKKIIEIYGSDLSTQMILANDIDIKKLSCSSDSVKNIKVTYDGKYFKYKE